MSAIKLLTLSILLFHTALFASANSPFEKRAPFKEATITYRLGGSSTGSSTLYVKDYGKYLAEHEKTTMSMFGFTKEENKLSITTPNWVYTIDMAAKTGTKMSSMEKYLKQEYEKLSSSEKKTVQKNTKKFGANMMQNMGGDVKFNAAMLYGYSCDKSNVMGMTSYTIHDTAIVLKMEGSVLGMKIQKEAIDIKKGVVDSSHFKVPSDIKITHDKDADAMMKQQASQMIQILLDPNKAKAPSQPTMPFAPSSSSSSTPQDDNKEMQEVQHAVGKLFNSLF